MPLYEYYCEKCTYIVEELKPASERNNSPICPECYLPTRRLPSAVGRPKFNGSGFHETDYSKKKKK